MEKPQLIQLGQYIVNLSAIAFIQKLDDAVFFWFVGSDPDFGYHKLTGNDAQIFWEQFQSLAERVESAKELTV